MNNLNTTKNKVYTLSLVVLGLIVLWAGLFYMSFVEADKSGVSYRALEDFQKNKGQAVFLSKAFSQNKTKIDSINAYFVTDKNVLPFIEFLEGAAKNSNISLSVKSVSLDGKKNRTEDGGNIFSLRVEGSYSGTIQFLKIAENAPFLLFIESVVMQATETEEGGKSWVGDINISLTSLIKEDEN